jgi:predicted DNA-binding transcriptional regulator AlpA
MNETNGNTVQGSAYVVSLTVPELQKLIREEVTNALEFHSTDAGAAQDKLLTAPEAAELIGMSSDWLYRNSKKLPFTRKLGAKALRFSRAGLEKWLAARKFS